MKEYITPLVATFREQKEMKMKGGIKPYSTISESSILKVES